MARRRSSMWMSSMAEAETQKMGQWAALVVCIRVHNEIQ